MQVGVVGEADGWLHCVASNGEKGLVPASIVTRDVADQHAPITSPFAAEVRTPAQALHLNLLGYLRILGVLSADGRLMLLLRNTRPDHRTAYRPDDLAPDA